MAKRGKGKPFKRGKSGNPKGRPKLTAEDMQVRALAQVHTLAAINTLAEIMDDKKKSASCRIAAAKELLDRGHGKPTTPIEVEATVRLETVTVHIAGRE